MSTDPESPGPPQPDPAEDHFRSGNQLLEQGKWPEAIARYEQALSLCPCHARAQANLGVALAEQGKLEEATARWRRALEIQPDFAQAHNNLGAALARRGELKEARAALGEALRLQPGYAEAVYNLGVVLMQQGRRAEAMASFEEALRLRPDHAQAYNNLGLLLTESGRPAEAAVMLGQAVRLRPSFAEAHNNLGLAHAAGGRADRAEACYQEALRLNPAFAAAQANRGNLCRERGRLEEALAWYQLALWHDPDSPARWGRALTYLARGDFERGWPEYESRWQLPEMRPRDLPRPRWDGSPLGGRTILLYMEQGAGDVLQFVRYACLVRGAGGRVILECRAGLVPLLSRCAGVDALVAEGEELPAFDVQAPLMSLPLLCGTTLSSVPAEVPYLFADPDGVAHWRRELAPVDAFKVGIAWQGNLAHAGDRTRSVPLAEFEPLARVPGVRLYNLQKGSGAEQVRAAAGRFEVSELVPELDASGGAFMETAAIMKNLDLVVSADTAVAHLAGGLAVPVWVALATDADWRWLRDREDSPWYPTMRLFRQTRPRAWAPVFRRMAAEVRERLAGRARRGPPP